MYKTRAGISELLSFPGVAPRVQGIIQKLVILVALASPAVPLSAQSGLLQLRHANDVFFDSDRDFTGSLELVYHNLQSGRTYYLGQELYTAASLGSRFPAPWEHPYAAWLYVGLAAELPSQPVLPIRLAIELGTVGPRAGGREMQNFIHKFTDNVTVRGWPTQIFNEWGARMRMQMAIRPDWLRLTRRRLSVELTPIAQCVFGNIQAYAEGGAQLRAGLSGLPASPNETLLSHTALYLTFSWQARRVFHNIFLEGNRDPDGRRSRSVVPVRDVYDLQYGIAARARGFVLQATVVRRSREFTTQWDPNGSRFHIFSIARAVNF